MTLGRRRQQPSKSWWEPLFEDTDGSVFHDSITWLPAMGITKGCNPPVNDRFCPNDFVTRGQMAAFLKRASST